MEKDYRSGPFALSGRAVNLLRGSRVDSTAGAGAKLSRHPSAGNFRPPHRTPQKLQNRHRIATTPRSFQTHHLQSWHLSQATQA
jgi:hypothetical protein